VIAEMASGEEAKMAVGDEKRVDLVFEGGGVKGIALVGACSILEERGYEPQNIAGTSAGAIVGALVAAGYSAKELHDLLLETPFSSFQDDGWEDKILGLGIPITIVKDHGIYEGEFFLKWMRERLAEKNISTFGQLRVEGEEDPRWRYRLQVIVSDVTHHSLLVLPRDAQVLGKEPDELEIAEAVRMSMSIPLFFEPVRVDVAGDEVVLVDGGMLSNFPVWLFDSDDVPEWPTFGLKLVNPQPKAADGGEPPTDAPIRHSLVKGLFRYLLDLVGTMTDAHDKLYLERESFVRTITISNLGVKATDFDLSAETGDALYKSGQDAATEFLETWDFEAYKAAFREGKEQLTRRDAVTSRMKAMAGNR
jgi:NTE family protein